MWLPMVELRFWPSRNIYSFKIGLRKFSKKFEIFSARNWQQIFDTQNNES